MEKQLHGLQAAQETTQGIRDISTEPANASNIPSFEQCEEAKKYSARGG
jgi:hypothetical protein